MSLSAWLLPLIGTARFKSGSLFAVFIVGVLVSGGAIAPVEGASGDEGSASGVFMRVDPGARSSAMGSAFVGAPAGPYSSQFNPAALGSTRQSEVGMSRQDIFQGVSYNNFSTIHSLGNTLGGVGVNVKAIDYGTQKRREISGDNPVIGGDNFSADDVSIGLGWGKQFSKRWDLGFRLNHVRESIAGYSDETISLDLGTRTRLYGDRLVLGLTARNLVGDLALNRKSDPLPRVVEGGLFYQRHWRTTSVRIGFDYAVPSDADSYFSTGLELGWRGTLYLRGGYKGSQEAGEGFTVGGGINHRRFSIDYANVEHGELGRHSKLSVSYRFGSPQSR